MKNGMYVSAVILISQFCVSNSWASGANFKIFGDHIEPAKGHNAYTATITVGQSLEIVAKGFAYPSVRFFGEPSPEQLKEALKGHPCGAEAGTWMFDYEKLRLVNTESDPKQYKIVLQTTTPGQHVVRFVGLILGRLQICEIQVHVSPKAE